MKLSDISLLRIDRLRKSRKLPNIFKYKFNFYVKIQK